MKLSDSITTGNITVSLSQRKRGNCVDIYSPWTKGGEDDYDITLHDFGDSLGMACTGESDYYCSVDDHEAEVFAWEIQLAASIYRAWSTFWDDPEYFLQNCSCPIGNYPVVIEYQ